MTKETAIGIAVAVLFVAALWFGLPLLHSWNGAGSEPGAISAGFVGQKQFGQWVLNCPSQQAVVQNNSTPPTFSLMPGHGSPFPSAAGAAAP